MRAMTIDLLMMAGAFGAAAGAAGLAGAANLGTALGVGQVGFMAAVVYVLLRR